MNEQWAQIASTLVLEISYATAHHEAGGIRSEAKILLRHHASVSLSQNSERASWRTCAKWKV